MSSLTVFVTPVQLLQYSPLLYNMYACALIKRRRNECVPSGRQIWFTARNTEEQLSTESAN